MSPILQYAISCSALWKPLLALPDTPMEIQEPDFFTQHCTLFPALYFLHCISSQVQNEKHVVCVS